MMLPVSEITRPACGGRTEARMPGGACQFSFDCPLCGRVLRREPGDCCVFCSCGTVPSPPVRSGAGCGN